MPSAKSGSHTPQAHLVQRRDVLKMGSFFIASWLGVDKREANAMEQKVYSSNAKNLARLSNGDSSGGSVYDNNPTSPKARRRRAMVGCKNSSARSLAGKNIGNNNLSEKECNQIVMDGDGTFMLDALIDLDCPTCPYGIANR
jgi:UDP-N-acetylenolpyruvoylglucosamine reductase